MMLTVTGLVVFETVSSIDNAIINAEVLSTMGVRARKWFLVWGMIFAVFVVRGFLPLFIIWITNPSIGAWGAFTALFSNDPAVAASIERSAPFLLVGGGVFLVLLFFRWLFTEKKNYAFWGERVIHENGVWFFAVASIFLTVIVWYTIKIEPFMAFAAVLGSTTFFISHGFQEYAEQTEKQLMKEHMSDFSKIVYLEVVDAIFSMDGVFGAFAFTLSVPLILLGNGLGALVVRQLTVGNIHRIKKYAYLKNGAMYSILLLGCIMLTESFGVDVPLWVAPVFTSLLIALFFFKSTKITLKPAE